MVSFGKIWYVFNNTIKGHLMKKMLIVMTALILSVGNILAGIDLKDPGTENSKSFVIVVDKITYEKIESNILAYKASIENDGLSAYVMIIDNVTPEDIKEEIIDLYNDTDNLQGAVFVGDIPIPMIRDGQHLTSAFKMDQTRRSMFETSVPSDRYYEDFDLKFDFIKHDSVNTLAYYYSLRADSPQRIEKEIYSGRIKAPFNNEAKYSEIAKYLDKVVEYKKNPEYLNKGFVFLGHGYHSEAISSWADEQILLRELFPQMYGKDGGFKFMNFSMSHNMKTILMGELENKEYDIALFHAHGAEDTQYLVDYPAASSITDNIKAIKRFVRSKVRTAKRRKQNVEEAKKYYMDSHGLPEKWLEGIFDPKVVSADSLYDYEMDMHSDDLDKFDPQARFVMFDECFNGAFHTENYISGRYIFDSGNTLVGDANSVNVLQDKWSDRFLGLLNFGVSIGEWHKSVNYLENHIIGDPTFHFQDNYSGKYKVSYNSKDFNEKELRDYLKSDISELRALAIHFLAKMKGAAFENELVDIYNSDNSFNVRLHAFNELAIINGKAFHELLKSSYKDQFEYIRRKAAEFMGEICTADFIPYLVDRMFNDQSERVSFTAKVSLSVMDQEAVREEMVKYVKSLPDYREKNKMLDYYGNWCYRNYEWLEKEIIPAMKNDSLKLRKRISQIRSIRNYRFINGIPEFISILKDESMPIELRISMTEALGWYYYSAKSSEIIKAIDELIEKGSDNEIFMNELLKTKNRLETGCNVTMTP